MRSPARLTAARLTAMLAAVLLGSAICSPTASAQGSSADVDQPEKPGAGDAALRARNSRIKVSPETTHITEPLREDGMVDYLAAMNERYHEGVTKENNAAILLWQAFGPRKAGDAAPRIFKGLGMPNLPADGDYLEDITEPAARQPDWLELSPEEKNAREDELWNQRNEAGKRPWTRQQFPVVAAWLDENTGELKLIVEATKRPGCSSPLVVLSEPPVLIGVVHSLEWNSRIAAHALTARAMLAAGEGRFEDARRDLLASHRLARLVGRNPFLIPRLVAIAIDTMTHYADRGLTLCEEITAEELESYRKELEAFPPLPSLHGGIDTGERFVFLNSVSLVAVYGAEAMNLLISLDGGGDLKGWKKWLWNQTADELIDWNDILRRGNQFHNRLSRIYDESTYAKRKAAFEKMAEELQGLRRQLERRGWEDWGTEILRTGLNQTVTKAMGDVFLSFLLPPVIEVHVAETRATAHHRLTLTALALALYQREHGDYPESLAALSPKYLQDVPEDPFVERPLRYRRTDGGYLLYSVGANRKDDGGVMEPAEDQDDVGVQVPIPSEAG